MAREAFYYNTCRTCGYPFADAYAVFGGASHFETECPQCGCVTRTKVVSEHQQVPELVKEMPEGRPSLDDRAVWGVFNCDCGATGEIRKDVLEGERGRLTSYCRECKSFSRWYWDFTSGTVW